MEISSMVAGMRQLTDLADRGQAGQLDEHAVVAAFARALVDDPRVALVTFGSGRAISPAVEPQRRLNRRWGAAFAERLWGRAARPIAIGRLLRRRAQRPGATRPRRRLAGGCATGPRR